MKSGLSLVDNGAASLFITWGLLLTLTVPAFAGTTESVTVNVLDYGASAGGSAVIAASDGIEIRTINVTGLVLLDQSHVLTGLTIKAGDIIVGNATAKLKDASEALYNTGWFRGKPVLSLDAIGIPDDHAAILQVEVVENPVYQGTTISGNTLFSTERLMAEIEDADGTGGRVVKGEVINARKLVSAIDAILGVYQDAGYIAAAVNDYSIIIAPGPNLGMVELILSEGIVEEVIIVGANKTKEYVITSQITHIRPGSVLHRRDLERDLNQIYNTGLFNSVTPQIESSIFPGKVKVVINVEEAPTGQAGFGLGYSTINGIQGTLSYQEKNLFGSGKAISGQLIFSRNDPGFEITFSDPYYTEDSFWSVGGFSLHNRQRRFPGQPYESELLIDTAGVNLGYGQHLSDFDTWQVSTSVTNYDYEIRKGDPFRGYSPQSRSRLSASGETRKIGLTYSHDTRDNIFSSTQGYLAKVTTEIAGFGGDFDFNKWTFEGREFVKLGPGTFGMRQRLGMANGNVPIYEEYRMGGVNSVRGVSEDLLTGTKSFLWNTEYRYTINDMLGVVAFMDHGFAGESFSDMDYAAGAGIGARIKLAALGIGAVRLDYAWELAGQDGTNNRFHFFLGEMF